MAAISAVSYCPDFAIFGFKNAVEKPAESAKVDPQAAAPVPANNDEEAMNDDAR